MFQQLLDMAVQVSTCVNLTVNAVVAVVLLRRGRGDRDGRSGG